VAPGALGDVPFRFYRLIGTGLAALRGTGGFARNGRRFFGLPHGIRVGRSGRGWPGLRGGVRLARRTASSAAALAGLFLLFRRFGAGFAVLDRRHLRRRVPRGAPAGPSPSRTLLAGGSVAGRTARATPARRFRAPAAVAVVAITRGALQGPAEPGGRQIAPARLTRPALARTAGPIATAVVAATTITAAAVAPAAVAPRAAPALVGRSRPRHEVHDVVILAHALCPRRRLLALVDAYEPRIREPVADCIDRLDQPIEPLAGDPDRLADRILQRVVLDTGCHLFVARGSSRAQHHARKFGESLHRTAGRV